MKQNIDGRRERHLLFFGGQKSPLATICFFFLWFLSPVIYLQWWASNFSFFCSKDVDARAFLCWCSYAPYYRICDALFLLISLTDFGTQLVKNKDRRQKLIYVKLIYYKYPIINHKKLQWNVRMVPILHSSCINMMFSCPAILFSCTFLLHWSIIKTEDRNKYMKN
jgi:hypothetical protein